MRVHIIQHFATAQGNYPIGSIIDVTEERANTLVKDRVAEYVDAPAPKPEPAKTEVKPEVKAKPAKPEAPKTEAKK